MIQLAPKCIPNASLRKHMMGSALVINVKCRIIGTTAYIEHIEQICLKNIELICSMCSTDTQEMPLITDLGKL